MFSRSTFLAAALCGAVSLSLLSPGTAHAQDAGNVDLDGFRPAIDSRGYITVNASQVLAHGDISFGMGALDWGHKMLTLENGANTYEVTNMFTGTLVGAVGLKFGPIELEPGISVPVKIWNGDRSPDDLTDVQNPKRFKLDGQGIGNIGLHLKTRFLKTSKGAKIGVGAIASLYLPTGILGTDMNPKNKWLGEDSITPQLMLIVDKEFGAQRRFRVGLNAGIRLRKDTTFLDNASGVPSTGQSTTAGAEIPFGLALGYAIVPQKFDLIAEVFGAASLKAQTNYQSLEAVLGAKYYLGRNSFFSFGGGRGLMADKGGNPDIRGFIGIVYEPNIGDRDGDGYKDDVDKCPDDPEDFDNFKDEDGCSDPDNDRDGILDVDDECPLQPETKNDFQDEDGCPDGVKGDRDGDGILDEVDKCPDDPEDKDGFEDDDGCPDPDNDKDGILDVDDLCPLDPEDIDNWEDEDGCPELDNDKDRIADKDDQCNPKPGQDIKETQEVYNGKDDEDGCPDKNRINVTEGEIEVLDMIYFETAKAVIKKESYEILDAVAATLKGNPGILLIEIQGHTDERGNDAYNLDLSDRRAHAVEKYIADKGVDPGRLSAQGYGETQPKINAHNEAAWSKNRRVAFLILKREKSE
jgi:outer membrane protein OmpA-like peptidoglycan-associated protein